jgi:hypothetical protein
LAVPAARGRVFLAASPRAVKMRVQCGLISGLLERALETVGN